MCSSSLCYLKKHSKIQNFKNSSNCKKLKKESKIHKDLKKTHECHLCQVAYRILPFPGAKDKDRDKEADVSKAQEPLVASELNRQRVFLRFPRQ